jgi:hypothetical protein
LESLRRRSRLSRLIRRSKERGRREREKEGGRKNERVLNVLIIEKF